MKANGKILIVMDGSQEVLMRGIRIARDEKARVTVLRMMGFLEGDLHLTGGIEDLHAVLGYDSPLPSEIARGIRVMPGYSTDSILEVAEEEKCDLIVMGTRKRKGVLGRIFGNAAVKNVINHASCPVYVVGSSCEPVPEPVRSEKREVELFA